MSEEDQEQLIPEPDADDHRAVAVSCRRTQNEGLDCVEIHAHREAGAGLVNTDSPGSVLLARVSPSELRMFPLVSASYLSSFLEPKYGTLVSISIRPGVRSGGFWREPKWDLPDSIEAFDELLNELPVGFGRHAKYGLGFRWEYRLIPDAVSELPHVTELVITSGDVVRIEGHRFHLGSERFIAIRKGIDAITNRARARSLVDRKLLAYNETLHAAAPDEFTRRYAPVKPDEIYELVQLSAHASRRSTRDSVAAAELVKADAAGLAEKAPEELLRLKAVIELVTLKQLIDKLRVMLNRNLPEPEWQKFFKDHPFVLSLAFPYPVVLVQDQAHVGGMTLRGSGETIADFLLAQQFTGNLALVEIKRPDSTLVEARAHRGDLHAPHRDMTSAMAQVLEQKGELVAHFLHRKANDPDFRELHASAVHCIVIVGTMPVGSAERRSLELFRHSLKDVVIVTFDELLAKLSELHRLMSVTSAEATSAAR